MNVKTLLSASVALLAGWITCGSSAYCGNIIGYATL